MINFRKNRNQFSLVREYVGKKETKIVFVCAKSAKTQRGENWMDRQIDRQGDMCEIGNSSRNVSSQAVAY